MFVGFSYFTLGSVRDVAVLADISSGSLALLVIPVLLERSQGVLLYNARTLSHLTCSRVALRDFGPIRLFCSACLRVVSSSQDKIASSIVFEYLAHAAEGNSEL